MKILLLKQICFIIFGIFLLKNSYSALGQAPLCTEAQPFCSDVNAPPIPNQTNSIIPVGPDYGCLAPSPPLNPMQNPQWFYFQVSDPGSLELEVSQQNNLGQGIDLDFVMWGPFIDLTTGCTQVMDGEAPIQCSTNPSYTETIGLGLEGGGDYWHNQYSWIIDGTSTPPPGQIGEIYIVLLTNADGQSGTISLEQTGGSGATDCNITVPCQIEITTIPTNPTCNNACDGEITITTSDETASYMYEWIDHNNNIIGTNSPIINGLCAGTYHVKITDINADCSITYTITLTDPNTLDATFSLTDFCFGETNNATNIATPGGTFSFNPSVSDGATINPTSGEISDGVGGTTYYVEYETPSACPETSIEQIMVYETPDASFTANPMITNPTATNITFTSEFIEGNTYTWDFGDGSLNSTDFNTSHVYPNFAPANYLVTLSVTSALGCHNSSSKTISIEDEKTEYDIPNVFTPNNDQVNDVFKLINAKNIHELDIVILNRWGNVVFESNSIDFHWNGKNKDSEYLCGDGTYFYKLQIKTNDGKEELKHGFVQLSRGN